MKMRVLQIMLLIHQQEWIMSEYPHQQEDETTRKAHDLKIGIVVFSQRETESLNESRERNKPMLRKCPNDGFYDNTQIHIFKNDYNSNIIYCQMQQQMRFFDVLKPKERCFLDLNQNKQKFQKHSNSQNHKNIFLNKPWNSNQVTPTFFKIKLQ